jgi:GGDEF domain-containing protein
LGAGCGNVRRITTSSPGSAATSSAVIKSGVDHQQAAAFPQRITEALTKPIRIGTEPVRVSCSIGIALAPDG